MCDPDPLASESLLQPHQARHHGIVVNDCAKRHLYTTRSHGEQCMKVNKNILPLMFDSFKVFCIITKPSSSDLNDFQIHELTSSMEYNPQRRCHTRRLQHKPLKLQKWRKNLGTQL